MAQNVGKKLQNYGIVESYVTGVYTPDNERRHDIFSKIAHEDVWNDLYQPATVVASITSCTSTKWSNRLFK